MATSVKSLRLPDELWAALTAQAQRQGVTVNALAAGILAAGMGQGADPPAPDPDEPAPKPVRPPKVAAAAKPRAAKAALASAEARTGVASIMESLPMGNTRPAYQKGAERVAKDNRGRR